MSDDAGEGGDVTERLPTSDIDLWSDDNLRDPYAAYAVLRELGPVVMLERHRVLAITRYDGVRSALQDWRTFSSAHGIMITDEMNARAGNGVIMSDPPDHDRRRKILNQQLVPRRMQEREEFVRTRARALIDDVVARRTIDAVHDLGVTFSVSVVGDLVGLPNEGRDRLVDQANASFNMWGPAGDRYESGRAGFRSLLDYVAHVAVPERLTPGGWGTEIFDAAETGDVAREECAGIIQGYIHAGMDTTSSAIASAVLLFGQYPEAWDAVRADRDGLSAALNEVIRVYSPVQRFTRFATVDTEIEGVDVPAGSRVVILIGSANRDERKFADPDRFDITRRASEHIGFGFGVHHCAGAALARTELTALFDALADRVAGFELGEFDWGTNAALHGLSHLDVTMLTHY